MIMSKTPLRICFFSGGSDLPAFYAREPGASLSATIESDLKFDSPCIDFLSKTL